MLHKAILKFLFKAILLVIQIENRQYLKNLPRLIANFEKKEISVVET